MQSFGSKHKQTQIMCCSIFFLLFRRLAKLFNQMSVCILSSTYLKSDSILDAMQTNAHTHTVKVNNYENQQGFMQTTNSHGKPAFCHFFHSNKSILISSKRTPNPHSMNIWCEYDIWNSKLYCTFCFIVIKKMT